MTRYRRLFDLRLGTRRRVDAEMDLEIETHLAMRIADLERAGMSADAARAEARRRFGDLETARRRLHAGARQREALKRQRYWMQSLIADFRYAGRQMHRARGFTLIAVAILALGIGSTTTMFTLVERVLLRPLPYPEAERLVALTGLDSARNTVPTVSAADFADWRRTPSLRSSALYGFPLRQSFLLADSAVRVDARLVTGGFFDVLRPRLVVGRTFTEAEARELTPVVVVSEKIWREMLAGDPLLAMPLRTATRSYNVVGVVARGDEFPARTDVWFPVAPNDAARVNVNWHMIARLASGATAQRAGAELGVITRGIRSTDPTALYDFGVDVTPLHDAVIGDVAPYLRLLMGAVVLVLVVVCANVAAFSLAHGVTRAREMAVRASLGASRSRLLQLLLVEHVLLGLLGGAVGMFLAWGATRAILARWGAQIPRAHEVSLDAGVFLFALFVSLLAGAVAGVVPAFRLGRGSLGTLIAAGGRTVHGGRRVVGAPLVTLEVALALLLVTGATLLVRSFRTVLERDIGFETNVATVDVALSGPLYARDSVRRALYWRELLSSFERIPGVRAVGAANWVPLGLTGQSFVEIAGRDTPGAGAVYRSVTEGFFRALRIPVVTGRTFDARDEMTSPRVVVINQRMAAMYWPGENPIGRLVRASSMEHGPSGRAAPWLTIIGVVGDVRTFGLESEPRPEMYVYARQTPSWTTSMTALVRADGPATRIVSELRRRARDVDPRVGIDMGTLHDLLRGTLATRTLTLWLVTAFAGVALLLAALGVYGVLSHAVTQRRRELAVRAALGAPRRHLLGIVFESGAKLVLAGLTIGVVTGLLLMRVLESMLVGVSAVDPVTYAGSATLLLVVAAAAMTIPARRATASNPASTLHAD